MAIRGRGPKNTVSSDKAEFFKVFLPHLSSQQLSIPPDFLKDFKRTIREKVILKDVGGKMWHVDVKETPDGVFLKNGWQNFISDHSLEIGDFLVFRYDGSYSFVVKIFGRNGCKKEDLAARRVVTVKNEEETDEDMEAEQTSQSRARPDKEDHLLRGNRRTGNSKRFEEVHKLQEQIFAPELPENCEDLENAERLIPMPPYFISPPCQPRKFKLRIPDEVINKHNLHLEPEMMLRNANGKEWPIKIFILNGPTFIGKGWLQFQIDNKVGLNDRCKFTFETERRRTINVQILRCAKTRPRRC